MLNNPYLTQQNNNTSQYHNPPTQNVQDSFQHYKQEQSQSLDNQNQTPQWSKFQSQQPYNPQRTYQNEIKTTKSKYINTPNISQQANDYLQTQGYIPQRPIQQYNNQFQQQEQYIPQYQEYNNEQTYYNQYPQYIEQPILTDTTIRIAQPPIQVNLPQIPNVSNYPQNMLFKPNNISVLQDYDDRGYRYPEYHFKQEIIEDVLPKILINMATQEEKIENSKIRLFVQLDFRIANLFSLFDYNNTGIISIEEFIKGLKQFSLQPDQWDLKLLFLEYGSQGQMDIQQFGNMIRPIRDIQNTKAFDNDEDIIKLLPETKQFIRQLLVTLLNAESVYEACRNELEAKQQYLRQNLDYNQQFDQIFEQDHDQINRLKYYLQANGQYFERDIILSLFKRFDRNNNQYIGIDEFINGFLKRLGDDDYQL